MRVFYDILFLRKEVNILNNRIKAIRKQNKMTQVEFGEKIGVKGNTITNYENGLRSPSNAIITSICREFNINEKWLRTGQGEMYYTPKDKAANIVSDLLEESNPLYDIILGIAKTYQQLDSKSQVILQEFSKELLKNLKIEKN